MIEKLLGDPAPSVLGSAVAAFNELTPRCATLHTLHSRDPRRAPAEVRHPPRRAPSAQSREPSSFCTHGGGVPCTHTHLPASPCHSLTVSLARARSTPSLRTIVSLTPLPTRCRSQPPRVVTSQLPQAGPRHGRRRRVGPVRRRYRRHSRYSYYSGVGAPPLPPSEPLYLLQWGWCAAVPVAAPPACDPPCRLPRGRRVPREAGSAGRRIRHARYLPKPDGGRPLVDRPYAAPSRYVTRAVRSRTATTPHCNGCNGCNIPA